MSEDKIVIPDGDGVWTMTDAEFKRELAKAWDEGSQAGADYEFRTVRAIEHGTLDDLTPPPNPYRSLA